MSKWNYAQWDVDGRPYLDQAGWCALTMVICKKDLVNLENLFVFAKNLSKI